VDLPFCKICGERHSLGFCPDFGPIEPPKVRVEKNPEAADRIPEKARQAVAAQDQGGADDDIAARPFTPEDMKQESMPITRPRFDRNKYQRELMKKRYDAKKANHG
jgi:hypothetical protein